MRQARPAMWAISGMAAAALIVACGGGGEDATESRMSRPRAEGDVVGGGASGGRIFLDLNGNRSIDPGEPEARYAADGTFDLATGERSAAELAAALVVAEGTDGTTLEAPAAVLMGLPAGGRIALTPLSTLVAAEVLANALTPQEASAQVVEALGLGTRDPLSNYRAAGDSVLEAAAADAVRRAELVPRDRPTPVKPLQRFVVQLKDGPGGPFEVAGLVAAKHQGVVGATYQHALRGFAIALPADQVDGFMSTMAARSDVELVEPDATVKAAEVTQSNPSWGLDRIDQRALPLSASYTYAATGATVQAYILDTGVRSTHRDFATRMASGYTAIADGKGTQDCNGHGTHVAGIVAGMSSGVAKGATIVPVRVLQCSGNGDLSSVLAGLEWIVSTYGGMPSVVNMSITSPGSAIMDGAVERLVASRISIVAAAGNGDSNACKTSPARVRSALTVAATDAQDRRANYSNYGTCVKLFAPGSAIVSAGHASDEAFVQMSGTSMAAPHVAGLVAQFLEANPTGTPQEAADAITSAATTGRVTNRGAGSPDALLFTDLSAASLPPIPPISTPISWPISSPISAPTVWPPVIPVVYAGALTGYGTVDGRTWRPTVTVTIAASGGPLVAGAEVVGGFDRGGSQMKCVTGTNGSCVIQGGKIASSFTSATFTIRGVYVPGIAYESGRNVRTSLQVSRP